MSRTERIVAVDVAVARELLRHFLTRRLELSLLRLILLFGQMDALLLVILLHLAIFGLVETGVLKKRNLAGLEGLDDVVRRQTVGNELDFLTKLLRKFLGNGLQRERRLVALALRTTEVAHEDEATTLLKHVLDRGERRDDARIVGNLARAILGHRHIEINTHDDALALELDVAQSLLVHLSYTSVATALLGGHLVHLKLCTALLAISRILLDDTLLHGLVETRDEFLELLLGSLFLARIGGLEEVLVRIVQLRLHGRVALVRLRVLTVTLPGGAAALDVSHIFLYSCFGMFECVLYSFLVTKIKWAFDRVVPFPIFPSVYPLSPRENAAPVRPFSAK